MKFMAVRVMCFFENNLFKKEKQFLLPDDVQSAEIRH